jgi:hypothetical protein
MNLLQSSKLFLKRNSSTILTCVGGVGVIATAVTAAKATPKAMALLDKAKDEKGEELTTFEKVRTAAPAYIPSAVMGAATIACIFGANALNKRQQAALMSAYALLDNSYKEYKAKVTELYGEDADTEVRKEIAKNHYEEQKPSTGELQLFYDEFSQRYFESTTEKVLRAEYELNRMLAECYGVFLNEWYDLLGIDTVDYGDFLGWSTYELVETTWMSWVDFEHTKTVMNDGLEVTIISMRMEPTFDFENY